MWNTILQTHQKIEYYNIYRILLYSLTFISILVSIDLLFQLNITNIKSNRISSIFSMMLYLGFGYVLKMYIEFFYIIEKKSIFKIIFNG